MSGQQHPARPTPPQAPRDTGALTRPHDQRRAHYRARDDQPVLVQLLHPDPPAAVEPGEGEVGVGVPGHPALSFVTRLTDLSESGLRLRLPADRALLLPLGAEVELVVSLPETNEELRGRVVHRDEPGLGGAVVVGVAFAGHDRGTADRLRRHVFRVQQQMLARRRLESLD